MTVTEGCEKLDSFYGRLESISQDLDQFRIDCDSDIGKQTLKEALQMITNAQKAIADTRRKLRFPFEV